MDYLTRQELAEAILGKDGQASGSRGFHSRPSYRRADYIYVASDEQSNSCWYRLFDGGRQVWLDPENESCVTGRLFDLQVVDVKTDGFGIAIKFDFYLDIGAGLPVVIRSGASVFTEGLLRSMLANPQCLKDDITICTSKADKSKKVVFSELFSGGKLLVYSAESGRLITWESNDRPRRNEILETFLPAANKIRSLIGKERLSVPIDRSEQKNQPQQSSPPPSKVQSQGSEQRQLLLESINATILKHAYKSGEIISLLRQEYKQSRLSYLTDDQLADFDSFLKVHAISSSPPTEVEEEIPF